MINLKDCRRIGIKLSSGCDSAIVMYGICKEAEDIDYIQPFTCILDTRPYQEYYVSQILDWMREHFPHLEIRDPHWVRAKTPDDYVAAQDRVVEEYEHEVDIIFSGLNQSPPQEVWESFGQNGPGLDRVELTTESKDGSVWRMRPLAHKNKKEVCEAYKQYGVLETLYPLTFSCEGNSSMDTHCGECWQCKERLWGFGRFK